MKAVLAATIATSALAATSYPQMGAPQMGAPMGMGGMGMPMGGMGMPMGGMGMPMGGMGMSGMGAMGGMGALPSSLLGAMGGGYAGQGRGMSFTATAGASGSNGNAYGSLQAAGAYGGQGTQGALTSMYGQAGLGQQYSQQRSAPMSSNPAVSGFDMSRALSMGGMGGMGMGGMGMGGMGMGGMGMGMGGGNSNYDLSSMFSQLGSQMQGYSGIENYGSQQLNGQQWQPPQSGSGLQGPGVFGGGSAMAMSQRLQQANGGMGQGSTKGFAGVTNYQSAMNSYGQNAGYQQAPSYTF